MIGNNIERKSSIKFLGVMLHEHISWIDFARTAEKNREKYWFTLLRKPVSQ